MSAVPEESSMPSRTALPRIVVQRKDGLVRIVVRSPGKAAVTVKQMRDPRSAVSSRRATAGSAEFGDRLRIAFGRAVAAAARESRKQPEKSL